MDLYRAAGALVSRARSRRRKQARDDARGYQIAPAGTPIDGPGWHKPPPGMTLTWDGTQTRPEVAVKRNGVLLATGLPPVFAGPPFDWGSLVRGVMRDADGALRVSGTDPMVLLTPPDPRPAPLNAAFWPRWEAPEQ